jgi:hypothetical protein
VCAIGFLYFHYGIYQYDKLNQKTPIRINRLTGETSLLSDDGVWMNKNDISKQHQLELEEELKKNDVPTVSLIAFIPDADIPSTGSKYDRVRARKEIEVTKGQSVTIDTAIQNVDIWWKNFDKDAIKITFNGHDLDSSDSSLEGNYFYPQLTFNTGENQIVVKTSRGTYKYTIIY